MPDGTVFVASGSQNGLNQHNPANNNPTYEMLDHQGISSGVNVDMDLLINNQPYFMYPFVHLLKDGTLFVFVSKSSQVFDPASNQVILQMPDLPGRNIPLPPLPKCSVDICRHVPHLSQHRRKRDAATSRRQ